MVKKKLLPRIAPLQRVVAETITDPAELEALDRAHERETRRRRAEEEELIRASARVGPRAAAKRRR